MSVSKLIKHKTLNEGDISHVIQMAWEDRTSFETIKDRVGLTEAEVISLMRIAASQTVSPCDGFVTKSSDGSTDLGLVSRRL